MLHALGRLSFLIKRPPDCSVIDGAEMVSDGRRWLLGEQSFGGD